MESIRETLYGGQNGKANILYKDLEKLDDTNLYEIVGSPKKYSFMTVMGAKGVLAIRNNKPEEPQIPQQAQQMKKQQKRTVQPIKPTVAIERPWSDDPKLRKGNLLEPDKHNSLIKVWFVLRNKIKKEGWSQTWYSHDFVNERDIFSQYEDYIIEQLHKQGSEFINSFHRNGKSLNGYKYILNAMQKFQDKNALLHVRIYMNTIKQQQNHGDFLPMLIFSWSHNAQKANENE